MVNIVGRVQPAPPDHRAPKQRRLHPPYEIAELNGSGPSFLPLIEEGISVNISGNISRNLCSLLNRLSINW